MTGSAHASKAGHFKELIIFMFRIRTAAERLVNEDCSNQLISEWIRRNTETFFVNMNTPTVLGVIIFFPCLSFLHDGLLKQMLTVTQNYCTGTQIQFCDQRLLQIWKKLIRESLSTDFPRLWLSACYFTIAPVSSGCLKCALRACIGCRRKRHWCVLTVHPKVRMV